jgi:hypothetical protein
MSRSYGGAGGAVDVKCAGGGVPAQFIWRDRLYRVNHVLQQWDTSTIWWQDVSATPTGSDRRTWRVEASAGRCEAEGVYELSFDPVSDRWHLLRALD